MNRFALEELRKRIAPHKEYKKSFIDVLDSGDVETFLGNVRAFCKDAEFKRKTGIDETMLETILHLDKHAPDLLESPSRRDFLKSSAALAAGAAVAYAMPRKAHAQHGPTIESIEDELTRLPSEVIRGSNIIKIDYDGSEKWKEEYLSHVFQDNSLFKKPVLALFTNLEKDTSLYSKTATIILKYLAQTGLSKDVKFLCVNLPPNSALREYTQMNINANGTEQNPMGNPNLHSVRSLPPIRGPPSFALYSPHHYLKGEKIERFMLVDIAFMSPSDSKNTLIHYRNLEKWISSLLFSPLPNGQTYKYGNTSKIKPI